MTYGFNPNLASWSPFHGAVYAIIESVSKYVAIRRRLQKGIFDSARVL